MDWTQTLIIIGVNIVTLFIFYILIIKNLNKIHTNIKSITAKLDKFTIKLDGHAARIDQLYSMFISLIKEKKE